MKMADGVAASAVIRFSTWAEIHVGLVGLVVFRSYNKGVKYSCNQCNFKGTQRGNLKIHIKFPCELCDYKATYKTSLLTHIKLKHKEMLSFEMYYYSSFIVI